MTIDELYSAVETKYKTSKGKEARSAFKEVLDLICELDNPEIPDAVDMSKKMICAEDVLACINNADADVIDTHPDYEEAGFSQEALFELISALPAIPVIPFEEHLEMQRKWAEKYAELRENFIDYVCSGVSNLAPYCANKSGFCVNARGWCIEGSGACKGFSPK